jgi:heavy metal sensor kinase
MRRRILVLLVPSTALALLLVGAWIQASVRDDLTERLDQTLLVAAHGVAAAIEVEVDGSVEFELEGSAPLPFDEPDRAFYVVRSPGEEVVASSLAKAPSPFRASEAAPTFGTYSRGPQTFRTCTISVVREPEDDEEDQEEWLAAHPGQPLPRIEAMRFSVTTAHSTAGLDRAREGLQRGLLLGFGLLFGCLLVLPWGIVTWALLSLKRLSAEAEQVGPERPTARLQEKGTDCEVAPLVRSFNRALDRLETAYRREKKFTEDAAHELRTPVAAIRAQSEVALRAPREPTRLREALESIHGVSLRMGEMLESLLALARFQGGASIDRKPTDLAEVVREAMHLHSPFAQARGVKLEGNLPASVIVDGNEPLLLECVSALLHNGVRYTAAGGRVDVELSAGPPPSVSVVDTGIGIPDEEVEKIFDRFYRVDRSRSRADGGTGLGLAIAREIAHLHGGELRVRSRLGKGSRFTLVMASKRSPAPRSP